jgi:23S rRNA (guanosine2251-2'-O)-methyltransferase
VLDHVVDPHNLGAIARSVMAAGLSGLVLPGRRAAPLSAAAFKSAAGALETVPVARVNSIADTLGRLRRLGLWSVGLDQAADQPLWGLSLLTEPVALVVGEEGGGLSQLVASRVEVRVRIPMAGPAESLNASVAAALAAFEVARVRSGF